MTTDERSTRPCGPIFVVGAMGSGTTLMRLLLDSHEHIAIPQETGFMRAAKAHMWIPFWVFGGRWYRRLGLTRDDLHEELRRFYGRLFERFAQSHGKQRWGEKTPWHVWHLDDIMRLWPDAAVIGMTRHPGGNVASLMTRFGYTMSQGVRHWRRYTHEVVRKGSELGDNFVLCRYEDLVLHPEETMREVLEWLGEPWSDAIRRHHDVQAARGGSTIVEGRTRADEPIDAARITRWLGVIDETRRRTLGQRTAALASFLGYGVDEPTTFETLTTPGGRFAILLDGSELAKRQAAFRDAIEFDQPMPVPLADRRLRPDEVGLHSGPYRTPGAMARARAGGPHLSAATRTPHQPAPATAATAATRTRRILRRILRSAARRSAAAVRHGLGRSASGR